LNFSFFLVALITALTQLDTIETYLPFIKSLTSVPVIRSFLSGFLPTVALVQFMANLPKIFAYMAKLEGIQSWSEIDASAASRYVWFQIINVLFVSALTGDIIQRIGSIISQPASLINLLGTAIPGTYMFFASYLMLMAFAVYPLELARLSDLFCKKFKMKRAQTKKLWDKTSAAPLITGGYAKQYGYIMLAFAITLEFATVAPLLLPFGVLFFGFCYVILRHHIYYVYDTEYEGMGKIFPWLMFTICLITVICQITLMGIFYGRKSPIQATLTWPLIFLVLIFYYVQEKKHSATFNTLSMQELKKSEDISCKKLEVKVTSRSYAWLISNTVPNDYDLNRGIAIEIPAAQIYLNPVILQHRLGKSFINKKNVETLTHALTNIFYSILLFYHHIIQVQ
jgi:calcium permeable stress-gated cation channel